MGTTRSVTEDLQAYFFPEVVYFYFRTGMSKLSRST